MTNQLPLDCVISMDGQMPLDFDARQLARRDDASTSKAAAKRVIAFAGSHEGLILEWLAAHPDSHYRAIAAGCGLEPVAVGRRLKALRERGEIMPAGDDGRMQTWRKVDR